MRHCPKCFCAFAALALAGPAFLSALDPEKELTQYTRTVWTQAQGLPQDTIRAIAQTPDGYLWLATREGLARFDGYDFATFTRNDGALPSNGVTTLATGRDGALWIGTLEGVSLYRNGRFRVFTPRDGLPRSPINSLVEDSAGTLWVVSDNRLTRFHNGHATTFTRDALAPLDQVQVVYEDATHNLWVSGAGGLLKRAGDKFVPVPGSGDLKSDYIDTLCERPDGIWLGSNHGAIRLSNDGHIERFTAANGLPHDAIDTLVTDRAGNLWAGTAAGLSRFHGNAFARPPHGSDVDADRVWCVFEDREGDLWIGMNSALIRLRDDPFLNYGTPEGLPSDEPTVIRQDRHGTIWIGYHDRGLLQINGANRRLYTTADGLADNEIFNLRLAANGDLLIGTRNGLSRFHAGHFSNSVIPALRGRRGIYDVIEEPAGAILAATAEGVFRQEGDSWHRIADSRNAFGGIVATLARSGDGKVWVGMFNKGLRMLDPASPALAREYTVADGLSSNEVRSLYAEPDGALWIGTFGGGLNVLRNGVFHHYDSRHGMLSDNISHVEDDGRGNLWLSTTRGISEISMQQLRDFDAGRIRTLKPRNFGIPDGLRSAQCAPGFPTAGGGTRTSDGQLWFPTARGLAMLDPNRPEVSRTSDPGPLARITEISADGHLLDTTRASKLKPGIGRLQFRYTGVYLRAPERVLYSTLLEGLDHDWVPAGSRRLIVLNPLTPGWYRLRIRAILPEGAGSEAEFAFRIEPHFYQTWWFIALSVTCIVGIGYAAHNLRIAQVNSRFALVLEERTRLAREIHDTLAQNFLAISAQLDATVNQLGENPESAWRHLRLARRITRHSFTEARRAVTDLRGAQVDGKDLPRALAAAAHRWVAGSQVSMRVETSCAGLDVPADTAQNVLRIAQEAVTNTLKHSEARTIWLGLENSDTVLTLRVKDDGAGFDAPHIFDLEGGHFGILGMGERAQRVGGDFKITSRPGTGTEIEVTIPLS